MNDRVLAVITSSRKLAVDEEASLLERAVRDWYNDQDTGQSDQVWAKVPKNVSNDIKAILRTPDFTTGDDYFVWRCRKRQDVILLCRCLQHFPTVNYWGIAKARNRSGNKPPHTE